MQLEIFERERLAELESVVERGLTTFVEVGLALMEIRDERLYRESHGTFDDYCRGRWGFVDSRARQLIRAAETVTTVTVAGLSPPANEAQARELAPLLDQPEALREAWVEVTESHSQPTARGIRETVQAKMSVHYSSETDDWATPQDLFDLLNSEFSFELDVCASPTNAKCDRFYSREDNGLAKDWLGTCWMNPPYGREIEEWIRKAYNSAQEGATVVCLVPARTDTAWWWDYARHGEVRFLRGRLKFGQADTGAPFPSVVVVLGRPATVKWWDRWPR